MHGTQKPVEAMRRPMLNNASRGQAVYEPFSGSGTSIIAAETTGRVCLAMELDPAYVDVAVTRWQDFTGEDGGAGGGGPDAGAGSCGAGRGMRHAVSLVQDIARILLASAVQLLVFIGLDPALARETAPGAALTLAARLRFAVLPRLSRLPASSMSGGLSPCAAAGPSPRDPAARRQSRQARLQRRRAGAARGLPRCPEHLSSVAAGEWDRVAPDAARHGRADDDRPGSTRRLLPGLRPLGRGGGEARARRRRCSRRPRATCSNRPGSASPTSSWS